MQLARETFPGLADRLKFAQRQHASLVYRLLENRVEVRAVLESRARGASAVLPRLRLYRFLRTPLGFLKIADWALIQGGSAWPLSARIETVPGGALLHLLGEVDLLTAPTFRERLRDALRAHERIVVDCSRLDYIDVTGIHILEDIERDYPTRLAVMGSKPIVRTIFDILQLRSVIPVLSDRESALKFLQPPDFNS